MAYSNTLREEELKLKVARDFFSDFDTSPIIGNIDFCVAVSGEQGMLFNMNDPDYIESILWAEAKKGTKTESGMYESLVQLILTIGKARTFDKYLPPAFLGAFDAEKISFIPYEKIMAVFSQNDFNWNVTPSNHETKEFIQLYTTVKEILETETLSFYYDDELKKFIKRNFVLGNRDINKVSINKNNFVTIFTKWADDVMPTIAVNWDVMKKAGILPGEFYLADLLSEENSTIIEKLYVLLKKNHYEYDKKIDGEFGDEIFRRAGFSDGQKAHKKFWLRYNRPPKEEYWSYIVERRDLLVPQDVRERKGSFFTPQKWVELSQKYIADVLGEDWQDEYYIWDCAAGTGNLLAGLTNKYKIFASTLDKADVEVMKERIANGANLLESHVFQFDFLNDDLQSEKVPESLRKILADERERKKLVLYINPPYAEAASAATASSGGENKNKANVSNTTKIWGKYIENLGKSGRELFVQFFIRIYLEINGCRLAEFSKIKHIQSPNFENFRQIFRAKLEKCFLVPGNSFDNVKGNFPIGFFVWNTGIEEKFSEIDADFFDEKENKGVKKILNQSNFSSINTWLKQFIDKENSELASICCIGNDFQHQNYVNIDFSDRIKGVGNAKGIAKFRITRRNLIPSCIYFSARHCIEATWLNDRDQFLYPKDTWQTDYEFQADCLAYTLFHGQNRISFGNDASSVVPCAGSASSHYNFSWNPFTESELNACDTFADHFMSDFVNGKLRIENGECDLFSATGNGGALLGNDASSVVTCARSASSHFSKEAKTVLDSARELYRYYHAKINSQFSTVNSQLLNASFYDIRAYFQGKDANGRMNNTSDDEKYNELIADLRAKQKLLAKKIEAKVYEHGFLR